MQLVDVQDSALQRLLARAKPAAVCDAKTGWMTADTWQVGNSQQTPLCMRRETPLLQ